MTQELKRQSEVWVERLARFGYASKGIVYAIIGLLSAQAAFGIGGEIIDTQGALRKIVTQPFGQFLLGVVAIGLLGYVLWRFVQAIKDPEHKGTNAKGILLRIGYAISGTIYGSLAFSAVQIIIGSTSNGNSRSSEDLTAWLLSQPFGQWLLGTIGAFIVGLGFYQFYKAFTAKFRRKLNLIQLSNTEEKWVIGISRFGLAARGIVFCIIGFFIIQAAKQSDASEVGGTAQALQALAQQPYIPWLLTIVAFGLIAYGIYMIIQARYRRIDAD